MILKTFDGLESRVPEDRISDLDSADVTGEGLPPVHAAYHVLHPGLARAQAIPHPIAAAVVLVVVVYKEPLLITLQESILSVYDKSFDTYLEIKCLTLFLPAV